MKKILLVDDDPNILAALFRQFRKEYTIETALGPEQGLTALESGDEYAVVMADMNMPGMNGVEFLTRAKVIAPQTVRLMLTGNADQATAAGAVNEGSVFRFLTKPCSTEDLTHALSTALNQHQLIVAEKELLEKTLHGSVQVLTEILALFDPLLFGRIQSLQDCARSLGQAMAIEKIWELETAAMLASIGYVSIPPDTLAKTKLGQKLSPEEQQMLDHIPEVGRNLLAHIPRMEEVAQIIFYQNKRFNGTGFPNDRKEGEGIPLGARILKVLADMVEVESKGVSRVVALEQLRNREGWYDPRILDAAYACFVPDAVESEIGRAHV